MRSQAHKAVVCSSAATSAALFSVLGRRSTSANPAIALVAPMAAETRGRETAAISCELVLVRLVDCRGGSSQSTSFGAHTIREGGSGSGHYRMGGAAGLTGLAAHE